VLRFLSLNIISSVVIFFPLPVLPLLPYLLFQFLLPSFPSSSPLSLPPPLFPFLLHCSKAIFLVKGSVFFLMTSYFPCPIPHFEKKRRFLGVNTYSNSAPTSSLPRSEHSSAKMHHALFEILIPTQPILLCARQGRPRFS